MKTRNNKGNKGNKGKKTCEIVGLVALSIVFIFIVVRFLSTRKTCDVEDYSNFDPWGSFKNAIFGVPGAARDLWDGI